MIIDDKSIDVMLQQAQQAKVDLVRFLYCGNDGLIRGKATHINALARRLREGMGMPKALQVFTCLDQPAALSHFGPVGEVRLLPDPATFAVLPYVPGQARLFCTMVDLDRQPWAVCPRAFLQRMLTLAAQQGMQVHASFENEFYLLRHDGEQYLPFEPSRAYTTAGMDAAAPVIADMLQALSAQGLEVESYHPEYGPGQHELSIGHTAGIRSADNQLAFRDTVRSIAHQHGLIASFAPSPLPKQGGSGCHLHLSLWSGGRNLFYDPGDTLQLSALAYHFIGGLLTHLPALIALTAPSVNSYRRLRPNIWSAAYCCYGPDNREAAIRIPSPFWSREAVCSNLEFRPCDASCNPYLALGGVLAAGLDGIAQRRCPGSPVTCNPASLCEARRRQQGIRCLPQTLDDALNALQNSAILTAALGADLTRAYLAVKRAEVAAFKNQTPAFEREQLLELY